MSALCCIMPPCHTSHCTTRKLTTKTMHNMGEKFAMLLRESLHCITAMCIYIQRCSKIQLLIMCVMCILQPAGKWFLIYWYCYSCYTYIPITNLILFLKLNCYFFCHRMSQKEYAFYNGYFFQDSMCFKLQKLYHCNHCIIVRKTYLKSELSLKSSQFGPWCFGWSLSGGCSMSNGNKFSSWGCGTSCLCRKFK